MYTKDAILIENAAALLSSFPGCKAGEYVDELRRNDCFSSHSDAEIVRAVNAALAEAAKTETIRRNLERYRREQAVKAARKVTRRLSPDELRERKWMACLKAVRAGQESPTSVDVEGVKFEVTPKMAHAARCQVGNERKEAAKAKAAAEKAAAEEAWRVATAAEDAVLDALCRRLRITSQAERSSLRRRYQNGERAQLEAVLLQ